MKKRFRKEEHEGYDIGEHINIHGHINDPESWFLTVRPLYIFGDRLCKKTCTEAEIARFVYLKLGKVSDLTDTLMNEVHPFT